MMTGSFELDETGDIRHEPDRSDAERARDDRDMAARAAFLEDQPAQLGAVVVEQGRRAHGARDDDRIVRHGGAVGEIVLASELMQQPVGEIVEIVQPVAQIRVGLALHPRSDVVLHAFDGGLGGKSGHHRLAQPAHPAAVVGENAHRLQDFAMFPGADADAVRDEFVDRDPQRFDRRVEPPQFAGDILSDEILDDDSRFVQQHVAKADTVGRSASP